MAAGVTFNDVVNGAAKLFDGLASNAGTQKDSIFGLWPQIKGNVDVIAGGSPDWLVAVSDVSNVAKGFFAPALFLKDSAKSVKAFNDYSNTGNWEKAVDGTYYLMGAGTRVCGFIKMIDGTARFLPQLMSRIASVVMRCVGIINDILCFIRAVWDIVKISIAIDYLNHGQIGPDDMKHGSRLEAAWNNAGLNPDTGAVDPIVQTAVRNKIISNIFWSKVWHLVFQCSLAVICAAAAILAIVLPVTALWIAVGMLVVSNTVYISGLGGDVFDILVDPKMEKA